eukprot:CAMPEP_0170474562 /NCGR_PEP_ID=MMETSP0123-20130129/16316_1 /TAXON_ID=182087 /ORGANISM="Favella ehrenbergii, Strain Fehren 1" /LENGTH=46 /DNA_ID= /DNA_START= /DNA_END= /DNA_ORIENTATION=
MDPVTYQDKQVTYTLNSMGDYDPDENADENADPESLSESSSSENPA